MAGRRISRLNEQLRREVADVLARQVRDPRVIGVTVTGAKASPDLDLARVYVRLSTDSAEAQSQMEGLETSAAFVRTVLSRSLRLRRVPELRFVQDSTLESAARIEELLRSVRPGAPDSESTDSEPAESGPRETGETESGADVSGTDDSEEAAGA